MGTGSGRAKWHCPSLHKTKASDPATGSDRHADLPNFTDKTIANQTGIPARFASGFWTQGKPPFHAHQTVDY
jgi:hypothetical protein